MERQRLIIIAVLTVLISGCQQTEVLFTQEQTVEPVGEIIPIKLDITDEVLVIKKEPITVWEYLQENSELKNYTIDKTTQRYIDNHLRDKKLFNRFLENSTFYIFYVIEKLNEAELPVELALVPFIESNYDPFSISPSGAVGLWQFMPSTGRLYELDKSWWQEDRHDPFLSTNAAVEYFDYLFERFDNDLFHSLASYNAGPTLVDSRIKRNIKLNKDPSFSNLRLPSQTKSYIPKFIAIYEIISNPEKYNVELPDIPFKQLVERVEINGQVEILAFSDFVGLKPEFVYKLNAGYTKWASAPGEKSIFYIPLEKANLINSDKEIFLEENKINWITHKIKPGDSLWELARKYDTRVEIIKKINFLEKDLLSLNETILIPLSQSEENNFIPFEVHVVSEGDSLWAIASRYKLSAREIARNNSIEMNSILTIGQQLNIGNKNIYRTIDSKKRTILYSVKQGDNLYRIADLFGVEALDIKKLNDLDDSAIMPGQIIKIIISAF
ncbi:LysM peptidoglycan-binding domain-containing protein [Gammaproteobacteria bacterium]|nr:LysM peptidoglycan-binding domain-containing protein [Gammaproteobacteria bacterium]